MRQFGDLDFVLENLSSLAHVAVDLNYKWHRKAAETAIQKAVDMNPNKPALKFGKVIILMHALNQTHVKLITLHLLVIVFFIVFLPHLFCHLKY